MVGKIATTILFVVIIGLIQTTFAATGKIYINGVEMVNPSGCISVKPIQLSAGRAPEIDIYNVSNKMITLYHAKNCQGKTHQIPKGESFTGPFVKSIYVE